MTGNIKNKVLVGQKIDLDYEFPLLLQSRTSFTATILFGQRKCSYFLFPSDARFAFKEFYRQWYIKYNVLFDEKVDLDDEFLYYL